MRHRYARPLAAAALLATAIAPARAGIFNGTWKRSDGYFFPFFFDGTRRPQVTIMRGFCYDFDLNGDFIDLTTSVSSSSSGITSLAKTHVLNGAQNSVNGHAIGQITVHFCVSSSASLGDKTIKVLNFGGSEFDRLVVTVARGGRWSSFTTSTTPVRVNIPFRLTVNGNDLRDASVEGPGLRRLPDPSDINTDTQLRFTLVLDATAGSNNGHTLVFLRRFGGGTGNALTDPGMIRNASGQAPMTLAVTGTSPIAVNLPRIPTSGSGPQLVTPATAADLTLHAILGKSLRHLSPARKIDEAFCQGFPPPSTPDGATERDITVPTWSLSVSNPASGAFGGNASAVLVGPVPAPGAVAISNLASGAAVAVPFSRPRSVSRAILIFPATSAAIKQQYGGAAAIGCFQAVMPATDPRNWTDPFFELRLLDASGALVHRLGF